MGWTPDFDWVRPDLAVGGAYPMSFAPKLAEAGIGAVIDLREEAQDDAGALAAHGIELLCLPTEDRMGVTQAMLDQGVVFCRQKAAEGRRVLIHCQHGIGRAPTLTLCVLADRGWEPLEALKSLKARRWKVSPSPEQYAAWTDWLARKAPAARVPDFHTYGCVAYSHLAFAEAG